jgi:hypothetical protein
LLPDLDAVADGENDRLELRMHAELGQDVGDVIALGAE